MLSLRSIPNFSVICFHSLEVNRLPLSVMMSLGIPCNLRICCMKSVVNCRAYKAFLHDIKWPILVRRSMTTSIVSYSSDSGKSVMKSIVIYRQDWSGTSFGCCNPYGAWRTALLRWHVSQFFTYRLIVSLIFGQWYCWLTSSVVFAVPPCPASELSWHCDIMVVLRPSFSGIHIFSPIHRCPSFHWHSPRAIPFISFSPFSRAFRIFCNSVSFWYTFLIWCSFLLCILKSSIDSILVSSK